MVKTLIENMNKIAIVLPAYNEIQTIAATIEDFFLTLSDSAVYAINNRCHRKDSAGHLGALGRRVVSVIFSAKEG